MNYINVLPKPKALLEVTPGETDILNPLISYTDNTQNTHSTYITFGDGEESYLPVNNHLYSDTGKYNYQMIVVNAYGCTDTVGGILNITPFNAIFIPNSFTPNNDGLNDYFKPVVPFYKSVNLEIFNRWGTLIFSTKDIQIGWDGKIKGANSPNDVYIYNFTVDFLDGTTKVEKGTVTLVH